MLALSVTRIVKKTRYAEGTNAQYKSKAAINGYRSAIVNLHREAKVNMSDELKATLSGNLLRFI